MSTYSVRGVLAGAYRGRQEDRHAVTHAIKVDADGWTAARRTLCGRVAADSLVDSGGAEPAGTAPTCTACAARFARESAG